MNDKAVIPEIDVNKKLRKSRKIDEDKVRELALAGLGPTDIARHQGVQYTTIYRFLKHNEITTQAVSYYKANRSDLLAAMQCNDLELHNRIVQSYLDIDKEDKGKTLKAMPHGNKIGLISVLNNSFGTKYDKERLESGLSTANVAYSEALKTRQELQKELAALDAP